MPEVTARPQGSAENPNKKKFLMAGIGIVVGIAIILTAVFVYVTFFRNPETQEQVVTEPEEDLSRVLGESSGKLPYAPIDEKNVVSRSFDKSGGVIKTNLSSNTQVYLVVPEGEVIQNAVVSLLPYSKMPTQQSHGGISGDYGFGLQVSIKTDQPEVAAFLVFDVSQGRALSEAINREKYKNRCDPRFKWFNPFICARKSGVPARHLVSKDSTIITPIHAEKYNELIFTKNTVPIGIDGLIVTRIIKGDVYIPQKLDKELVSEFVRKTMGKYGNDVDRLEAAALAKEWDIGLNDDQLEILADSNGETYQEFVKEYHLLNGYRNETEDALLETKNQSTNNSEEVEEKQKRVESLEFIVGSLSESEETIRQALVEDAKVDTNKYKGDVSVEAASAISAAVDLGVDGADSAASSASSVLEKSFNQEIHLDDALGEYEALQIVSGKFDEGSASNTIKSSASSLIRDRLENPNSSILDLVDVAALGYVMELENFVNQAVERIGGLLEKRSKEDLSKEESLDLASLAHLFKLNSLASKLQNQAEKAKITDCNLIKENLAKFGINKCL